jgi:hypothetical protein
MSAFIPGQQVIISGETLATFVSAINDSDAIVRIGQDTRIVGLVTLKAA